MEIQTINKIDKDSVEIVYTKGKKIFKRKFLEERKIFYTEQLKRINLCLEVIADDKIN